MRAPELEQRLRELCEVGFEIGAPFSPMPRWPRGTAPTGEAYTEITNWGVPMATADIAFDHALNAFRKYADGKSGAIYWRITPEIAWLDHRGQWAYYMRVLISGKPVL